MISKGRAAISYGVITISLLALVGCSAGVASRPSLADARAGQRPQADDTALAPGETRAEVTEVDHVHREIRVNWIDGGGRDIIPYDLNYTRVIYHGFNYPVDALQPGDLVAFVPSPRTAPYIDTIRIPLPVHAPLLRRPRCERNCSRARSSASTMTAASSTCGPGQEAGS